MKSIIQFRVSKGEKYYIAECLDASIVTQAESLDELARNIQEALALHMEDGDLSEDVGKEWKLQERESMKDQCTPRESHSASTSSRNRGSLSLFRKSGQHIVSMGITNARIFSRLSSIYLSKSCSSEKMCFL